MAKSDSTRNPPSKVWLVFDSESRLVDWANHWLGIAKSDEQAHQYAPLQKPRRCVWRVQGGEWLSPHGRIALYLPKFCEDCGGKIARKS